MGVTPKSDAILMVWDLVDPEIISWFKMVDELK